MQEVTMKQLFRLLLVLGEIDNRQLSLCLDVSDSSITRYQSTPSVLNLKQFSSIARLAFTKDINVSMNIGSISIQSFNYAHIIQLCMKEFKLDVKELSSRLNINQQVLRKRISRNSCSLAKFKETIEAMDQQLSFSINGNKYLIK